ncbi:MAG: hypothetical protein M1826_003147 [Phylliscum demangeonii]|nr:MAG: hypothetical protein M1826_003147 [Phylliscum demangeonii]
MQGFNMGRHALGARARKLSQGILTVRFEMPFAVWCSSCTQPTIIGQGVRFNAEKKKVGNYHSTPIYSFRMKHVVCGGLIEIRTDPQNTAYVVAEGGKKRDTGEDREAGVEGAIPIRTEEEREKLRQDAFAALESKVEDKRRTEGDSKRIGELKALRERDWADPYAESQKLRKTFRVERKAREEREEANDVIQNRFGFDVPLLRETEEDRVRASLVEYGDPGEMVVERVRIKPLFGCVSDGGGDGDGGHAASQVLLLQEKRGKRKKSRKSTKAELAEKNRAKKKELLSQEIRGNTLAAVDPFLVGNQNRKPLTMRLLVGRKRKQPPPAVSDPASISSPDAVLVSQLDQSGGAEIKELDAAAARTQGSSDGGGGGGGGNGADRPSLSLLVDYDSD